MGVLGGLERGKKTVLYTSVALHFQSDLSNPLLPFCCETLCTAHSFSILLHVLL